MSITPKIPYIDADGNIVDCINYTFFNDDDTVLTSGAWYVIKDAWKFGRIKQRIFVSGSEAANFILCDGDTLELTRYGSTAHDMPCGITGNITIYGQSEGTGLLSIRGNNGYEANNGRERRYYTTIDGTLTMYGGHLFVKGDEGWQEPGSGGDSLSGISGTINMYGGFLEIEGGDAYNTGGKYRACGNCVGSIHLGKAGVAVMGEVNFYSDVTLSWSSPDDRFYASSISCNVDIVDGKAFTDGTHGYMGSSVRGVAGKTLQPVTDYALDGTEAEGRYDEAIATWENHKGHTADFTTLEPGRGYVYRHSGTNDIGFHSQRNLGHGAGEGNFHGESYTVTLSHQGPGDLAGFNLVGNPYPFAIRCERPCYLLNGDGTWVGVNGYTLNEGEGFLVYAETDGEELTITPEGIAAGGTKRLPMLPKEFCLGLTDGDNGANGVNGINGVNGVNGVNGSDGRFVYWDGEELVVTLPGHLEAYDILGRFLFSRELDSFPTTLPTSLFPGTGVYLLRLDGMSQKIVIK